jgi:NTP-dependent ternary system trypsin peptidase co-occuring protein
VSKYVEFPLEGGGSIVIETADEAVRTPSGFLRPGEAGAEAAFPARGSFDASVEAVRQSAELLVSKLRGLSTPPDELEISFSLKASSETASLVVGKAGAEANFGVLLRWRTEKADKAGDSDDRHGSKQRASNEPEEHYKGRKRRTLPPEQAERHEADDDQDDQEENRL